MHSLAMWGIGKMKGRAHVKSDCAEEWGRVCWKLYYMGTFSLLTRLGAQWDYFNFSDEETEAQKSELTC